MTSTISLVLFFLLAGTGLLVLLIFGNAFLSKIPKVLLGTLQIIVQSFAIIANTTVAIGWYLLIGVFLLFLASGVVAYFYWLKPGNIGDFRPPVCSELLDRYGSTMDYLCPSNQIRVWAPLHQIDIKLQTIVVMLEDDKFYDHAGFDLQEIINSIEKDIKTKKLARGASTITQQLAKNMYLSKDKTFFRKASEIPLALRMERELSKDQILELYLNTIEWGPDIYGVEAASRLYFDHSAATLSTSESWLLALMIPNPNHLNPWVRKRATKTLFKRGAALSVRLYQEHRMARLESQQAFDAFKIFLDNWAGQAPQEAPGNLDGRQYPLKWGPTEPSALSLILKSKKPNQQRRISTTLDLKTQKWFEDALFQRKSFKPNQKPCCALALLEKTSGQSNSEKIIAIIPALIEDQNLLKQAQELIVKAGEPQWSAKLYQTSTIHKQNILLQN